MTDRKPLPPAPRQDRALLTAAQLAVLLNVSRATGYALLQHGDIPSVRIKGNVRCRPEDADAYIAENTFRMPA